MSNTATEASPEYLAEDSSTRLTVTMCALIAVEGAVFSARLYSRVKLTSNFALGWDDILITLGLVANLAQDVLVLAMVRWASVGRQMLRWALKDPSKIEHVYKSLLPMEWTYSLAVCFPRLAILALYLRIFSSADMGRSVPIFRLACYGTMAFVSMTLLAVGLSAVFQCTPVAAAWDNTINGATCIDRVALFRWGSFPNVFSDIVILILPMPIIIRMQTNRRRKLELLAVFGCGGA